MGMTLVSDLPGPEISFLKLTGQLRCPVIFQALLGKLLVVLGSNLYVRDPDILAIGDLVADALLVNGLTLGGGHGDTHGSGTLVMRVV